MLRAGGRGRRVPPGAAGRRRGASRPGPGGRPGGERAREAHEAERLLALLGDLGTTVFRPLLWQTGTARDLTYAQGQVLAYVAARPGAHMGDVAKAFGVTLPAVTHIVDRLAGKRLVTRQPDPVDRRAWMVEPTEEGRRLAAEHHALRLDALARVLARMSGADRERLVEGLEALVAAAGLA
jgi:DNA-binding MarR family transcriptional regulator